MRTRIIAAAAILALVGFGCGTDDGTGGTADKPTIKLGFIGDVSGENANLIDAQVKAAELAISIANESGNLGYNVELSIQDNPGGAPDPAPALARKLIQDAEVVGVIGPGFSGETKATGDLFAEAELVHVSPSATNPDLTKNGWATFFRALATDDVQGGQTGDLIVKHLKAKTVAVVSDKSEYGDGISKAVEESVKAAGGSVVVTQGIEPTTDYRSIIDAVIAAKPDAFYYGGYVAQAPLVLKQYRDRGGEAIFVSGDGSKGANLITEGGDAAEGAILTCPCLDPAASDEPAAKDFVEKFRAEYDVDPDIYGAEGWDVANMLLAAIEDGGENVTRASVLAFITDLKDFAGVTKTFNWTDTHEVVGGEITFAYEVKDGKFTLLGRIDELAAA